jgi:hypothetical protein
MRDTEQVTSDKVTAMTSTRMSQHHLGMAYAIQILRQVNTLHLWLRRSTALPCRDQRMSSQPPHLAEQPVCGLQLALVLHQPGHLAGQLLQLRLRILASILRGACVACVPLCGVCDQGST